VNILALLIWTLTSATFGVSQFLQPVKPGVITYYISFDVFVLINLAISIAESRRNHWKSWRAVYMYGFWAVSISINLIRSLILGRWEYADWQTLTVILAGLFLASLGVFFWCLLQKSQPSNAVLLAILGGIMKALPQFVIGWQILVDLTISPINWLALASGHVTITIRLVENWKQWKLHKGSWIAPLVSEGANELSWLFTTLAQLISH